MSVIIFSFNPLIILETLVSGHNDIVMVFLVLLSFYLLSKKRLFLGTLFFVLSIFIKYATILLIPIFLYVLYKKIKNKDFNWRKIYLLSSVLMLIAFLLSPVREEIYPWYAIWFLSFSFLIPEKKMLLYVSISFSFGLLLRYVPYMFLGSYVGITPIVKSITTFSPPFFVCIYLIIKKIWGNIYR